jgi:hypothetical protein
LVVDDVGMYFRNNVLRSFQVSQFYFLAQLCYLINPMFQVKGRVQFWSQKLALAFMGLILTHRDNALLRF